VVIGRPSPMHVHRCGACGRHWRHAETNQGDAAAHMCPSCGRGSWWQARGRMRPDVARIPLRAPGQLAGMGEQYTPAAFNLDANQVIADLAAKLLADQRNGDLSKLLDQELARAHQFQTTGLAPDTLAVRVGALQKVRDETHLAYVTDPNSLAPLDRRQRASQAAGDVLRWWAAVTGQALKASNARASTVTDIVDAIKNSPKAALGWGLEALGLPKWVLPVGVVTLGLVALGSVTGSLHTVTGALGGLGGGRRGK